MSSAALWQPSTSRWVQVDSSLAESTLNTWVSTPCFVPERKPNDSSESRRGEVFPGPEWTSLKERGPWGEHAREKKTIKIHWKEWGDKTGKRNGHVRVKQAKSEMWEKTEGRKNYDSYILVPLMLAKLMWRLRWNIQQSSCGKTEYLLKTRPK